MATKFGVILLKAGTFWCDSVKLEKKGDRWQLFRAVTAVEEEEEEEEKEAKKKEEREKKKQKEDEENTKLLPPTPLISSWCHNLNPTLEILKRNPKCSKCPEIIPKYSK